MNHQPARFARGRAHLIYGLAFACLYLNLSHSTASAQLRTWIGPGGGDWRDGINWSGGNEPDTIGESALLGGTSTYTVLFDLGTTTIGGLSIDNTNATLLIKPDAQNTSLVVDNGFTNQGTISIDSDSTLDAALSINSGALTNNGALNFGGSSESSATFRRLAANLTNQGIVNVSRDAEFSRVNGTYTNLGTFNIASTADLDFGSSTGVFNQDGGTLNNQGQFILSGDTFNFNGGSLSGNAITLNNSTLNIGNGSTGAGTFNVTSTSSFSGDLAASQTLNIVEVAQNTSVTSTNGFSNFGTINLTSDSTLDVGFSSDGTVTNHGQINLGGQSVSAATIRRWSADLINQGTVNVDQDSRFEKTNGVYQNENTFNIAAGKQLGFGSSTGTFEQNAGSVNNAGEFNFVSDTLSFNGGQFTGNAVSLQSSTLNIGVGNNGTGHFRVTGSSFLNGDIGSNQVLNIVDGSANSNLTTTGDLTNAGSINLNSDSTLDVQFTGDGVLTNTGTITFAGSSSSSATLRNWSANLTNQHEFKVLENAHFTKSNGAYTNHGLISIATDKQLDFASTTGTFHQNGGSVANLGRFVFNGDTLNFNGGEFTGNAIELVSSTLNIGSGSQGAGTFTITGSSDLTGDIAAAQTLNVVDGSFNTTLTIAGPTTNRGTINLNSDSTLDVTLASDSVLTNDGLIAVGGTSVSSATFRRISAELMNLGEIDITAQGTRTELGISGANHFNEGTIISRETGSVVTVFGNDFTNQQGGRLEGVGEFDFTVTGMNNLGTIAPGLSPGELILDGDIQFGSTATLEIELGGLNPGLEFDVLTALDSMALDGSLEVTFLSGFENLVQQSDVFEVANAGSLTGTFNGLNEGATLLTADGKGTFTISYLNDRVTLSNFTLVAVPEPTGLVFLTGTALLSLLPRRRHSQTASS